MQWHAPQQVLQQIIIEASGGGSSKYYTIAAQMLFSTFKDDLKSHTFFAPFSPVQPHIMISRVMIRDD